jgi:hypothetical protein
MFATVMAELKSTLMRGLKGAAPGETTGMRWWTVKQKREGEKLEVEERPDRWAPSVGD